MKTKEFYTELYKKKWDSCLIKAAESLARKKVSGIFLREVAMNIYKETCSAEEGVGFFLFYHGDDALNVWKTNTAGVELSDEENEVGRILYELIGTELPLMEEIVELEKRVGDSEAKNTLLVDMLNKDAVTSLGFERDIAQNIFDIYRESVDKESIEKVFYELTSCRYHEYLKCCKKILIGKERSFLYLPYGEYGDSVLLYNHKNEKSHSWDITGVNVPTKKCPNTWTFWRNIHNNELVNTDIPHDLSESEMQEIKEYITTHRKALVPNMYINENIEWFSITKEKCISVWFSSNERDHLCMNLEEKANGTMGPSCQIINSESYGTSDLSLKAVRTTLQEICEDAGMTFKEDIRKTADRLAKEILNKFVWHGISEKQKKKASEKSEEKFVVLDKVTSKSENGYCDLVRCDNCGSIMLVNHDEDICPCCKEQKICFVAEIPYKKAFVELNMMGCILTDASSLT